jgi:hypothetical protein
MNAISNLRNPLVFHIIFRNRQTLSGKLSLYNYICNFCHQLWQKFTPDEKLQQMAAEFLLYCNSRTIGARNMKITSHPHFGTAHRKVRKERKAQPQFRTRMTRIARIFTDMRFFYDVNFLIYDAVRHESTSINYMILEGR